MVIKKLRPIKNIGANRQKFRFQCLWYSEINEPITKSDTQKFYRIKNHFPLVELESKNITAEVTETQGKIGCTIVCCLFNQNLSLWEPFVEPFNFHCSGLREKTGYSITVNPRNRLNINLTQNLVQLQKNILPRLQKLFSEKSLENHNFDMIRKKFRPYTLQNRTGMPVAFSTSGAQGGGLDFFLEIFRFFF